MKPQTKYFPIALIFLLAVFGIAMIADSLTPTQGMNPMEQTATAPLSDAAFIDGMIEHHMGAIAMAKEARQNSRRPEIQTMSASIITAQTAEIDQLYEWKRSWFNDSRHITMGMAPGDNSMVQELGTSDADFDKRFLNAMIRHHEGAIEMANRIIVPTGRPELHDLARRIIADQTNEIAQMKEWKRNWYGE